MAAKKIKTKKPPLSALDKFIYIVLILLYYAVILSGCWFFWMIIPDYIAFSDPAVVAYNDFALFGTILVCSVPMLIVLGLAGVPLALGFSKKQPIFGNKKFKVIGFQPKVRAYPIFTKAFRENLSNKAKKTIKIAVTAWGISFAAALLVLLLSLFPREVLDDRNNFLRYNSFNQVTASEHIDEAERLIIDIPTLHSRHEGTYPFLELHFVFEVHTYDLPLSGFREDDRAAALEYMLYLKHFFRTDEYEIANADRLDWLLDDGNYDTEETELLYELFDYTEE